MANSAFSCTALTGGTDGSLDNIDGSILSDGDIGYVVNATDESVSVYTLDASSGDAESSPDIISPDTNAGTKRWILTKLIGQGLDLDGNVLTLDEDGDTSIEASTDDYVVVKIGGSDLIDLSTTAVKINGLSLWTDIDDDTGITSAAGDDKLDVYLNGAKDFSFTPNNLNILSGSTLSIDSGADFQINSVSRVPTINTPSAAASTSFSLTLGAFYKLRYSCSMSSAGALILRVNSDSGTNYIIMQQFAGSLSGTGVNSYVYSTGAYSAGVIGGVDGSSCLIFSGEILLSPYQGNNNRLMIMGSSTAIGSSDTLHSDFSIIYTGSASISSCIIIPSAGTLTGTFVLERVA